MSRFRFAAVILCSLTITDCSPRVVSSLYLLFASHKRAYHDPSSPTNNACTSSDSICTCRNDLFFSGWEIDELKSSIETSSYIFMHYLVPKWRKNRWRKRSFFLIFIRGALFYLVPLPCTERSHVAARNGFWGWWGMDALWIEIKRWLQILMMLFLSSSQ